MAKKRYVVDGVAVTIDDRVFKDFRVLELQVEISSPMPEESDPEYQQKATERGVATVKFINLILGNQKEKVTESLAQRNDGFCDVEALSDWLAKLLTKVNGNAKK